MGGAVADEMLNCVHMTSTLEKVIKQAKALPAARQQELAEVILCLIGYEAGVPVISF